MNGVPQLEEGYTRIANELQQALCGTILPDNERRVFYWVIRLTYGFQSTSTTLESWSELLACGVARNNIKHILQALESKNMLKIDWETKTLTINKRYVCWQGYKYGSVEAMNEIVSLHTTRQNKLHTTMTNPHGYMTKVHTAMTEKATNANDNSDPQPSKYNKENKEIYKTPSLGTNNICKEFATLSDGGVGILKSLENIIGVLNIPSQDSQGFEELNEILTDIIKFKDEAITDCLNIFKEKLHNKEFKNRSLISVCRFIQSCLRNKGDRYLKPPAPTPIPEGIDKAWLMALRCDMHNALSQVIGFDGAMLSVASTLAILKEIPEITPEICNLMVETFIIRGSNFTMRKKIHDVDGAIVYLKEMLAELKNMGKI